MRTTINECGHCGITYRHFLSGGRLPQHNSSTYCEGCEKARKEAVAAAFKKIPVLFKYEFIPTDDYTLEDLLEIEKVKREHEEFEWQKKIDAGEILFPLARRVYSVLRDSKTGETSKTGRVKYNGESYSYFYWPSKSEEAEIKIYKKIDMTTGEPVNKNIIK